MLILQDVVTVNSIEAWERLLLFPRHCLYKPVRGRQRWSLASQVNRQISDETLVPQATKHLSKKNQSTLNDPERYVRSTVSLKLGEGDFTGAVRLTSSKDSLAAVTDATYFALQTKHPPAHPASNLPPPPDALQSTEICVTPGMVANAIHSFPSSSSGGPDGLLPQHLKDMLNSPSGLSASFLVTLASFVSLVLKGNTPSPVRSIFFSARLIALSKETGGVRPIAVGSTLRRLVAKVAAQLVRDEMSDMLAPRQLGFGVKGGAEAAVHAARLYLCNLQSGAAMVKLDFCNAFDTIRRDKMLEATLKFAPDIYPFVYSAYSVSSSLFWEGRVIQSAEGLQQGDPLGHLLFCLSTHGHTSFTSEFCVCYIHVDDITLGGPSVTIQYDLEIVHSMEEIGLSLNCGKSEVICREELTCTTILSSLPGAQIIEPSAATLLGSPLGDVESVSVALEKKIVSLATMGERLELLAAQDALLLLRHSFSIPKLLYLLKTAPCFLSPCLQSYDELLCSIISRICNVNLSVSDTAWLQASLPVSAGGLGLRSAVQLSPSAFLASAATSAELMSIILPGSLPATACEADLALTSWSSQFPVESLPPPSGDDAKFQRAWDSLLVNSSLEYLLDNSDESTKA